MEASSAQRFTVPLWDPAPRRGRRRRIYLKSLEVEVRPIMPGSPKMHALLDLLFPKSGDDFSTYIDEIG